MRRGLALVAPADVRRDLARGAIGPALEVSRTLDLPFRPRGLVLLGDGSRLVVADAFGGRLAVVDPARGTLESVRTLPAHNIRGLALTPDGRTLVVAHQVLEPPGREPTSRTSTGARS